MSNFKIYGLSIISEDYTDEDFKEFSVYAHCEISTRDSQGGGEAFTVKVVSPRFLEKSLRDNLELGRGLIIMRDFDQNKVVGHLQNLMDRSGAQTWEEAKSFIENFFNWFE